MSSGQPLLEVRDLKCVRDSRVLFSGLNLSVDAGELLSVQGANGAGKSTLLRCIAGLYPDYQGSLDVASFSYAGHKAGLCSALSTAENLQFLSGLDDSLTPRLSLEEALVAVGLAGYEDVRCSALSAGQLRRVGIARLLLAGTAIWLLDEPLTALDQEGCELLGSVLDAHLEAGGAALCATHQLLPVKRYRVLELSAQGASLSVVGNSDSNDDAAESDS